MGNEIAAESERAVRCNCGGVGVLMDAPASRLNAPRFEVECSLCGVVVGPCETPGLARAKWAQVQAMERRTCSATA